MDDKQREAWQRAEAVQAAEGKLAAAEELVRDAKSILKAHGLQDRVWDAKKALDYIRGAKIEGSAAPREP